MDLIDFAKFTWTDKVRNIFPYSRLNEKKKLHLA